MARVDDAPTDVVRRGELERLYREQGAWMWRSILAFAGDPEVASDAVAEGFAQALRRGHEIRDPERLLWRSLSRIAAGELKERGRTVTIGNGTWPTISPRERRGHDFERGRVKIAWH